MLDLEDKIEDIIEIYIDHLFNTDKTIGLVVNKEFAEYVLNTIVKFDDVSVKEVNLVDDMNTDEYLLSVDDDGWVTCVPIEEYIVLDNTDIFYIDMDGDIDQDIIDYCVNEDKKVILFGQKDDDCDGDCENCNCHDMATTTSSSTSYEVNGKEVTKEEYDKAVEDISGFLSFVNKIWDII
mgnify:CR=1 FL=1|nr:MAG TPA: hypothetical protein [Bacteriophage sp.]